MKKHWRCIDTNMTIRELEMIRAYKQAKTYQGAANIVGVSRQRIEQVIKKYIDQDPLLYKLKNRFDHSKESCIVCKRSFNQRIHWTTSGKCQSCRNYERKGGKRRRWFQLPPNCLKCGYLLKKVKQSKEDNDWKSVRKPGDLCAACYAKTPRYKQHQKNYRDRPEIAEKYHKRMREYSQKNKEWLREYQRQRAIKKNLVEERR